MKQLIDIYNSITKGKNDFCIENAEIIRVFANSLMIAFPLPKHDKWHGYVLLGEFKPNLSPVLFVNDSQWWTTVKEVAEDC